MLCPPPLLVRSNPPRRKVGRARGARGGVRSILLPDQLLVFSSLGCLLSAVLIALSGV